MKRRRIHFPSRMAKYFKAERKGFESNFSRRNFTNSQRASCKLRKTLVFIRFEERRGVYHFFRLLNGFFKIISYASISPTPADILNSFFCFVIPPGKTTLYKKGVFASPNGKSALEKRILK